MNDEISIISKYCPDCKQKQYSPVDKSYVKLFNTCWSCDQYRWRKDELSLEEFEEREQDAANTI